MSARSPRGPVKTGGGGAAVLQRVVDALWILISHYAAHLLYPMTSTLLAADPQHQPT